MVLAVTGPGPPDPLTGRVVTGPDPGTVTDRSARALLGAMSPAGRNRLIRVDRCTPLALCLGFRV